MNLLKLESWHTVSASRSLLPRNFSRRFLDTVVWGIKDQFSIRTGSLSCFRRGFPYLHHGTDEHGQHGEGKSEDVEKRDGSKSLLSGQDVVRTHAHIYCKGDQRDLGEETPWETKDRARQRCRFPASGNSPKLEHTWRWRWRQKSGRQIYAWPSVHSPWCLPPGLGKTAPTRTALGSGGTMWKRKVKEKGWITRIHSQRPRTVCFMDDWFSQQWRLKCDWTHSPLSHWVFHSWS